MKARVLLIGAVAVLRWELGAVVAGVDGWRGGMDGWRGGRDGWRGGTDG